MNLVGQANNNEVKMQILKDHKFQPCIENNLNFFSKITFWYTRKLIKTGVNL